MIVRHVLIAFMFVSRKMLEHGRAVESTTRIDVRSRVGMGAGPVNQVNDWAKADTEIRTIQRGPWGKVSGFTDGRGSKCL